MIINTQIVTLGLNQTDRDLSGNVIMSNWARYCLIKTQSA